MAQPLVSVGIPTFNRSKSLRRCLDAVLAQTLQDFEIILSDNGSTDETWRLCQELAASDSRVRPYRQTSTINSTQNFDFVRRRAGGSYVLMLGDDDWIDADYLEQCVAVLAANPDFIAVGGRAEYYRDDAPAFRGVSLRADAEEPSTRLLQALSQVIDAGTFHAVFRRSMSESIPIVNAFGMDYVFICEAAYCGKIATLDNTALHRNDNSHLKPIMDSVRALGLPPEQGRDHYGTIVALIFWYLAAAGSRFDALSFWERVTLAVRGAAIVFKRWEVRDEDAVPAVAQSIFPELDLADATRRIRRQLLEKSLDEIDDAGSALWTDTLPELVSTLERLNFRETQPDQDERKLLLRLNDALQKDMSTARRQCALTVVRLFY